MSIFFSPADFDHCRAHRIDHNGEREFKFRILPHQSAARGAAFNPEENVHKMDEFISCQGKQTFSLLL